MEQKRTLPSFVLLSVAITVAAQLGITPFATNFRLSIAVIIFSATVYLLDGLPILPLTLLTDAEIFLTRVLYYYATGYTLSDAVNTAYPEACFYLIFGLGLLCMSRLWKDPFSLSRFLPAVALLDFCSNFAEMTIRQGITHMSSRIIILLIFTALFRTIILWGVLIFFDRYRLLLIRRSNAERYHRLILLVTRLRGELTWMHKNSEEVERVMDDAYQLYNQLKKQDSPELAAQALRIAMEVHEIKKEYFLIMRGLSEAMEQEDAQDTMEMTELFALLEHSMIAETKDIHLSFQCSDRIQLCNPYYLLSVLHNLISNAMEAISPEGSISVWEYTRNATCHFLVQNNGTRIPPEQREKIFSPGFSTKINYETGVIARGLGLPIVKYIVETIFHGTICLEDSDGGTSFHVQIPVKELDAHETVSD